MKVHFHATEYHSDLEGYRVSRGRGFRWIAAVRRGHGWEPLKDDCASPEEAMAVCTADLQAWADEPDNDVEF